MYKFKKAVCLLLLAALLCILAGCQTSEQPFNGPLDFYDITVTVPGDFIRDSTQSTETVRVFEKGNYKELIIIMRNPLTDDADTTLQSYAVFMTEQGAEAQLATFLDQGAVHSTYTQEGIFCQEMLFAYGDSLYAIALRGSTEEAFQNLLDTVALQG